MILTSFIAIAVLVGIDQLIKFWAKTNLINGNDIIVIENIFRFKYAENKGAAFGILSEQRWIFISVTIIVICIGFYLIIAKKLTNKFYSWSAILLIAGGLGNIIDRVFIGYVVDMFDAYFMNFAIFNFADTCVTIGCILLVIGAFFVKDKSSEKVNEIEFDS